MIMFLENNWAEGLTLWFTKRSKRYEFYSQDYIKLNNNNNNNYIIIILG